MHQQPLQAPRGPNRLSRAGRDPESTAARPDSAGTLPCSCGVRICASLATSSFALTTWVVGPWEQSFSRNKPSGKSWFRSLSSQRGFGFCGRPSKFVATNGGLYPLTCPPSAVAEQSFVRLDVVANGLPIRPRSRIGWLPAALLLRSRRDAPFQFFEPVEHDLDLPDGFDDGRRQERHGGRTGRDSSSRRRSR